MIPDYEPAIKKLAEWGAAGVGTSVKNVCLEPDLPEMPGNLFALFETGGQPPQADLFDLIVLVVSRADTLKRARDRCRSFVNAVCNKHDRSVLISNVRINSLPALRGRDHEGRVIVEATVRVTLMGAAYQANA